METPSAMVVGDIRCLPAITNIYHILYYKGSIHLNSSLVRVMSFRHANILPFI